MTTLDGVAGLEALRTGAGATWIDRDVVAAEGPDATSFLQGQLSQDVAPLAVGDAAPALLLSPQGKLVALLRVVRTGEAAYLLDVDAGWGEQVIERLERFKLRIDCALEARPWRCLAVRGPEATEAVTAASLPPGTWAAAAHWPGLAGVDLLGPDPAVPEGIPEVAPEAFEVARIEAGVPRMGAEITERTIPAEAGVVAATVSFTKGCYTGQELVARIDSRGGNVARHLRRLAWSGEAGIGPGTALALPGEGDEGARAPGEVTSAARRLDGAGGVGLGYVRRAVEVPAELVASTPGGPVPVEVRAIEPHAS